MIAETALAAQGASRIAHSLRVAPPYKDARCHCPRLVHVQHRKDAQLNSPFLRGIYIQAACRLCLETGNHINMNVISYGEDVKCNDAQRYTCCVKPGAFCDIAINLSIVAHAHTLENWKAQIHTLFYDELLSDLLI